MLSPLFGGYMKLVKIEISGKPYYLAFNGMAMCEFNDRYGGVNKALDEAQGNTKKAFETLCESFTIVAEQGELLRRAAGYDHGTIPDVDIIKSMATPADMLDMKSAVMKAVMIGFSREVESEEDTDLVLLELAQKKTNI